MAGEGRKLTGGYPHSDEANMRWFECAHGHQFLVVCDTMPTGRDLTCPGCGTVTMKRERKPAHGTRWYTEMQDEEWWGDA